MNCIYHRWRTKDYRKYRFCTLNKQLILTECQKCVNKQPRQYKAMKKKSNKLSKLEKKRFSILTNDLEHCYICKERDEINIPRDDLHEIYPRKK